MTLRSENGSKNGPEFLAPRCVMAVSEDRKTKYACRFLLQFSEIMHPQSLTARLSREKLSSTAISTTWENC